MADQSSGRASERLGIIYGLSAYLLWGLLPAYMRMMHAAPPMQIVAHRAVWTAGFTMALVFLFARWTSLLAAIRRPGVLPLLMLSALLIGVNWAVYAWAVLNGHVLDASLGYFINPLVNVALGVIVLKERLRRIEKIAVGLAAVGVGALALQGGAALWVPIALALSFGTYGLVRKVIRIEPLEGLSVETMLLAPIGAGYLLYCAGQGTSVFGNSASLDALLISNCVVTAVPLMLFATAARRMRYSALGVLQYVAPTMQFLQAVLLFDEHVSWVHAFTFVCIWTGLALYAFDALRSGTPAAVAPPE